MIITVKVTVMIEKRSHDKVFSLSFLFILFSSFISGFLSSA